MVIDAVLFDLDGVLVDSYEAWLALLNQVAGELGCEPITREHFARTWGQGVQEDADDFFPGYSVAEIEERFNAAFAEHLDRLEPDPDGPRVFQALAGRGLKLGVVTNTPKPLARTVLDDAGLEPDVLVGGTDAPRPKPAPDLVLLACRELGVAPGRAVFVGDGDTDAGAAEAAGVCFVGYRRDGRWRAESLADVVTVVDRLRSCVSETSSHSDIM